MRTGGLAKCRNKPKSLSGIETKAPNKLKAFRDGGFSRNKPKSLSGIETK